MCRKSFVVHLSGAFNDRDIDTVHSSILWVWCSILNLTPTSMAVENYLISTVNKIKGPQRMMSLSRGSVNDCLELAYNMSANR